jgi:hypothetical protein
MPFLLTSLNVLDKEAFVWYNIPKLAILDINQEGHDDHQKHQFNPGSKQLWSGFG